MGAHRRFNPLLDEWVLVSPHRSERPWLGATEPVQMVQAQLHDPGCYLCPGNPRVGGEVNPEYRGPFVFRNDFPALTDSSGSPVSDELLASEPAGGECRVLCYSERHDLSLPELPLDSIQAIVECWCNQSAELEARYAWVQVFENKGEMMGCSNPHPHGQIWASDYVPSLPLREFQAQKAHWERTGTCLLAEYLHKELELGDRIIEQDSAWVLLVPFWASWPYETLLLPTRPVSSLSDLLGAEKESLAAILKRGLSRYDNLFECPFPYSMGWHAGDVTAGGCLHAHFFPPLLRSATVRKFMVGFEMLAETQRDITPEQAAERLRSVSATHYRERS